jgi:hypothetical protein
MPSTREATRRRRDARDESLASSSGADATVMAPGGARCPAVSSALGASG